jgi:hypothetical protein
MICHIEPVGPLAQVVNLKIIHDSMPDMHADQCAVQVEERGFGRDNSTSGLKTWCFADIKVYREAPEYPFDLGEIIRRFPR